MSTAARRRLMRDFKKLQDDPPNESILFTIIHNIHTKKVSLQPPKRTILWNGRQSFSGKPL